MHYFIKRLVWIIPMIIILSVCISLISSIVPEQQINQILENQRGPNQATEDKFYKAAHLLELDKPLFFFSIVPLSYPDTLFHLPYSPRYYNIKHLIYLGISWEDVLLFRKEVENFMVHCEQIKMYSSTGKFNQLLQRIKLINNYQHTEDIDKAMLFIENIKDPLIDIQFAKLKNTWEVISSKTSLFGLIIPKLKWHGANNQYADWISKILFFDFGQSSIDERSVSLKISQALKWTLTLSILALIIIFLISIPLGLKMASIKGSIWDRWISAIIFIFYSVPTFWLATLLIVFFTSERYCSFCDVFPSIGLINISPNESFIESFFQQFGYFILPVLCLIPGSIAYVYRQMRSNTLNELDKSYVMSARAKGLNEKTIMLKYIFPNAVFPLITLISSILPGIITGSLIIEFIFNIPGMGRLMYESILYYDWPVIKIILLLLGCITLLAYLITDIVYKLIDPRIKFS